MSQSKPKSNRIYAPVIIILAIGYIVFGARNAPGFYSDPVGPNLWIIGVGAWIIFFALLMIAQPRDFRGNFPRFAEWIKRFPLIGCIWIYAYLLPLAGFLLLTPLLMTGVSLCFKARPLQAMISAVCMTIGVYLVFDVALDIALPEGEWWRAYWKR